MSTLPYPQTPFLGKGTYYRFAQSFLILSLYSRSVNLFRRIIPPQGSRLQPRNMDEALP